MYKLQRDITPQFARESTLYAKCLERKCREIVESKLEDGQCGFRPGRSTTDQIFTLKLIFEKSWKYGKDFFACLVDLEKAYDRVPRDKLWKVLQEYGVNGQLLRAIKSFYCRSKICVRVNGRQSKPFHVGVGLQQGCVLSPLLFIVYMNWIDKCSQADECATIGNCKISRLLFADDLVLQSPSGSDLVLQSPLTSLYWKKVFMMQSPLLQQSCNNYLPFSFSPVTPCFPITLFHVSVSVPTCGLKSPTRTVDSVGDTRRRASFTSSTKV